jgi:hypothetical protein
MSSAPYIAVICTTERLPLRDDSVAGEIFFNVNLSTAVVANGAVDADVWSFIDSHEALLKMWEQTLAEDGQGHFLFDVFAIGSSSPPHRATGKAAVIAPDPNCKTCIDSLDQKLQRLIDNNDLTHLVWDPTNPSPAPGSPAASGPGAASSFNLPAWKEVVSHASTWAKPLPQGLRLSFEVGVVQADVPAGDEVVIFPRFFDAAVSSVQAAGAAAPWESYGGEYLPQGSPSAARWAYQAPCSVDPVDSYGLVNMRTYWVEKDPASAVESTSNWRQRLEATIASRFDYLPRLLTLLDQNFMSGGPLSTSMAEPVWDLGIRMLHDLSNFGKDESLEGSCIQYALILRALQGLAVPDTDVMTWMMVDALKAQSGDWQTQVWKMLQGVDAELATYLTPASPPKISAPSAEKVIPTLKRLYSALSNDDNLATLLQAWWKNAFHDSGSPSMLPLWSKVLDQLSSKVFPPAQLHKRYLSAIADKAAPLPGLGAPTLMAALGTPFPSRIGHTACLIGSMEQMLVFGGLSADKTPLNDVWTVGLANGAAQPWTQITPSGTLPGARSGHSAVFDDDAVHKQMFIFGGLVGAAYANDLWSLVFPASGNPYWQQLIVAGGPSQRSGHSAVYDPGEEASSPSSPPARAATLVLFGGDAGVPATPNLSNDVWILENANVPGAQTWEQLQPAGGPIPGRISHSAVYDPASNRMVVFGGATSAGLANDVWVLSNANGTGTATWSLLNPTGQAPEARQNHTAVYDATSNSMIVFGGTTAAGASAEVWVLSHANGLGGTPVWAQVKPSGVISAREGHTAVYQVSGSDSRMLVFSGGPNAIADLQELANPLASPEWGRLNPSGKPQLDAAVSACIRGWVNASAPRTTWTAGPLQQLDEMVAADINHPQTGVDTVADDAIVPMQRAHSVVIQVGAWNSTGQDDTQEDLRHVAGFGLLMRKQGGSPQPWRCLNAADITVNSPNGPALAPLHDKIVPSRIQYRSGMKDPYLEFDNHPKIAKSPATGLSGNFKQLSGSGGKPFFSYAPASGIYRNIYGLEFGQTFEFAPFAIGHGGAMPKEIELALNSSPVSEIDFEDPEGAVIRTVPYFRRVPVGHLRSLPGSPQPGWKPNQDVQWPVIPATVYPLTRDLGLIGEEQAGSTSSNAPLLLLPLKAGGNPDQFAFNVQAPTTDINTWDRWVAKGTTYGAGVNTQNTRKAVWAAFHRDAAAVGNSDVANNRIGDPAVAALLFSVQEYDPIKSQWVDVPAGGDLPVIVMGYSPVANPPDMSPQGSPAAWNAVWPKPVLVSVQASPDSSTHFQVRNGAVTIQVSPNITPASPAGGSNIARLTVTPLVMEDDFNDRFEPGIFTAENFSYGGIKYVSVGVDYQNLGMDQASFQSLSVLIECPTNAMVPVTTIQSAMQIDFPSALASPTSNDAPKRLLTVSINGLREQFLGIGRFEWRRQDWFWLGRPIPPYPPIEPWAPSTQYLRGDSVEDSASPGHRQRCTQSGMSAAAPPKWNQATKDGTVIWSDEGPWDATAWEKHEFLGRDNDFHSSDTRLSLSGGDSLQLTSVDLSTDLRCQYLRFAVVGHSRYEDLPNFKPSSALAVTPWKSYMVARAVALSAPPKPLIRLVLPIGQRSTFDLLAVGDESWYRSGGLGESLIADIEPVLGSLATTIVFSGSPAAQVAIEIDHFGGDNGVTYLDTGVPLTLVSASPMTQLAQGEYSITQAGSPQTAHYEFSPADNGMNVAISYLQLDQNGKQRYEYGSDQIVDASVASTELPLIRMEPMGATLSDPNLAAPTFINTYFRGTVENDPGGMTTWRQFKIRFRRELQPYAGSGVPVLASAWTDSMWVETLPDWATFQTMQGAPVSMSNIKASWTAPPPSSPPSGSPIVVTPQLAPSGPVPGSPDTGHFDLWYVVTQQITDAGGQPAEVHWPPQSGTAAQPLFDLSSGSYNLRIVEVQKSPAAPHTISNGKFLESCVMVTPGQDELFRIVRISPPIQIDLSA